MTSAESVKQLRALIASLPVLPAADPATVWLWLDEGLVVQASGATPELARGAAVEAALVEWGRTGDGELEAWVSPLLKGTAIRVTGDARVVEEVARSVGLALG